VFYPDRPESCDQGPQFVGTGNHPDGVKQDHVWVCTGKQIDNLAIAAEARVGHAEHVGESQDVLWKLRRHPEREDGSRGDPGRAGERRFGATPLA